MKKITTQSADKRFIKGKNIECKQKADKSAASKVKQLKKEADDLEDLKRVSQQEKKIELRFKGRRVDGISDGQPIVSLDDVSFAYDEASGNVLHDINAQIMNGDRILLEGRNGEGKTTLVRMIAGETEVTDGKLKSATSCTNRLLSSDGSLGHGSSVRFSKLSPIFSSAASVIVRDGDTQPPRSIWNKGNHGFETIGISLVRPKSETLAGTGVSR